jgi:hypothetical protein
LKWVELFTSDAFSNCTGGPQAFCGEENRPFLEPRSGGFPGELLDRAFYARGAEAINLKARFNGLVEGANAFNFKAR